MELITQELVIEIDGISILKIDWDKEPEGCTEHTMITIVLAHWLPSKPMLILKAPIDYGSSLHDFFLELIPSEHKHEEILRQLKDYMLTNNPM